MNIKLRRRPWRARFRSHFFISRHDGMGRFAALRAAWSLSNSGASL